MEDVNFAEMNAEEIAELVAAEGTEISEEEAATLRDMILQFGGLDEALEAIESLAEQRDAA